MIGALARKIFGTANDRVVRGLQKAVHDVNSLESQISALNDANCKRRRCGCGTGWPKAKR
jgi:preprotein translocase subunit SecA